jgi:hypothetical protein
MEVAGLGADARLLAGFFATRARSEAFLATALLLVKAGT